MERSLAAACLAPLPSTASATGRRRPAAAGIPPSCVIDFVFVIAAAAVTLDAMLLDAPLLDAPLHKAPLLEALLLRLGYSTLRESNRRNVQPPRPSALLVALRFSSSTLWGSSTLELLNAILHISSIVDVPLRFSTLRSASNAVLIHHVILIAALLNHTLLNVVLLNARCAPQPSGQR